MSLIAPLLLLLFNCYLEMMESAIFTATKGVLMEQEKNHKSKNNIFTKILFIKGSIKEVTIVILILDGLIQYFLSICTTKILTDMNLSDFYINLISIALSLFITYIIIVVKVFAISHSKNTLKYFGIFFYHVFRALKPLGTFFSHVSLSSLGKKKENKHEELANRRGEILATLESYEDKREMREEINMAKSVLLLKDINISQIMTHRSDFVLSEFSENIEIMKGRLLPFSFKKNVIIWEDTEDNVIGTINIQKFFIDITLNRVEKVMYYITPPQFFVHTTDVYRVLEYFKSTNNKIIFVIDEDGSISGIVTLSDIFNEIVGDTEDDNYFFKKTSDGYIVEGSYNIRTLNKKLDLELSENCSTIGGLIIMHAKKIPKVNEKFNIDGLDFIVKEISKNRIEMVLIVMHVDNTKIKK